MVLEVFSIVSWDLVPSCLAKALAMGLEATWLTILT